ncbi:MAG: ATP-grasp domain-containing protein [Deltaproteobacteria bacterium]|nr:ATP-grasp domain-containing protein [Deltaproteobacteria bacterium]
MWKSEVGRLKDPAALGARPEAFVIGDLSLVRALGREGVRSRLVTSNPNGAERWSRFVSDVVEVEHFEVDPEGAIRILNASAGDDRPVLFYQGDHDLLAVSRARERVERHFRVMLPPPALVEDLVDKLRFQTFAEKLGLPVPPGLCLVHGLDWGPELDRWTRFPAVIKPNRREGWFGSDLLVAANARGKAIHVRGPTELKRLRPWLQRHPTDVLLQQAIPGDESNLLSYHAYVRPGGEVVGEFTGHKVRTYPATYGLSTYVVVDDNAPLRTLGRDICERMGFSGVVKLDFKRDPFSGGLYLLEANPRFNLWHHPGALAGVNLPYLVYVDLVQPGAIRGGVSRVERHVRWVGGVGRDFWARFEDRTPDVRAFGAWAREVFTAQIVEAPRLSDPGPFLYSLLDRTQRLVRGRGTS